MRLVFVLVIFAIVLATLATSAEGWSRCRGKKYPCTLCPGKSHKYRCYRSCCGRGKRGDDDDDDDGDDDGDD